MLTLGYLLLKCVSTVQAAAMSSATLSASSVVEWRFLMACRSKLRSPGRISKRQYTCQECHPMIPRG